MSKDEKKVDLFNNSDRTIQTKEGNLTPKGHGSFSQAMADRLVKLYPDEVMDLSTANKAGLSKSGPAAGVSGSKDQSDGNDDAGDDLEAPDKMTVAELKAELDEADPVVEYAADAKKADLVELVKTKRASEAA